MNSSPQLGVSGGGDGGLMSDLILALEVLKIRREGLVSIFGDGEECCH